MPAFEGSTLLHYRSCSEQSFGMLCCPKGKQFYVPSNQGFVLGKQQFSEFAFCSNDLRATPPLYRRRDSRVITFTMRALFMWVKNHAIAHAGRTWERGSPRVRYCAGNEAKR